MLAPLQARRSLRRVFASALVLGLLLPVAVAILPAQAATPRFSESFSDASLAKPEHWVSSVGLPAAGRTDTHEPEPACLTGRSVDAQPIELDEGTIVGCPHGVGPDGRGWIGGQNRSDFRDDPGSLDPEGKGVLRLTDNRYMQSTMVLYNQPLKVSDGLDITFRFAMYNGVPCPTPSCGSDPVPGADGFSFFIKDGRNEDDSAGTGGAALGYALERSDAESRGIRGGLLGIGFDFFGGFSFGEAGNLGRARDCAPSDQLRKDSGLANREAATDRIVLRGADLGVGANAGSCGYEYFGRSADQVDFGRAAHAPGERRLALSAEERDDAARRARVVIDKPGTDAKVRVWVWDDETQPGDPIVFDQPEELSGVPTFKFGFSAGTGWATLVHEIWDLQIILADPVVQAVQAEQLAAASRAASSVSPTLVCSPDPVRPGAEVQCTIASGPAGVEILWRASVDGRVVDSRGVTLGADGEASFTFRAPSDAAGSLVDVELVDWGVATTVGVTGGPIPTRVDAGYGVRQRMTTDALLMLVAGSLALGVLGRRRSAHSS